MPAFSARILGKISKALAYLLYEYWSSPVNFLASASSLVERIYDKYNNYYLSATSSRAELLFSDDGSKDIDTIINGSFNIFKDIFGASS